MTFKFSFQKVLDVKEKEQEVAKQEYGTIKLKQMELQEQVDNLELEKDKVFDQYNHVHRKSISEILEFQEEIDHVNRQLKYLANQKHQVHQIAEQKQQILIDKSKEAKMWNHWKSKSKDAWKKQLEQKEQAMLDEMAILRYSRRG